MAHEISNVGGKANMAYTGEMPWHGLGTHVAEAMTAKEAYTLAGLDYGVSSRDMFHFNPASRIALTEIINRAESGTLERFETQDLIRRISDGMRKVDGQVCNTRDDTGEQLGVVSDKYKVVQNAECFDFLDTIVQDGRLRYETAGSLGVGERVWMLAQVPGDLVVPGTDDQVRKYLFCYNSHDASSALRILWTPVRVVCANTVAAALRRGIDTGVTIRHTGEVTQKVNEARRVLGLADKYFDVYGEMAGMLAGFLPRRAHVEAYWKALFPDPKDDKGADATDARAKRGLLWGLYEQTGIGLDMPGVKHTAWSAYNAYVELIDHHRPNRAKDRLEGARKQFVDNVSGDYADRKRKAFTLAVDMAEGRLQPVSVTVAPGFSPAAMN